MESMRAACGSGNMDLIQWLITAVGCGTIIQRACDESLDTSARPLYAACEHGHIAVARWLVAEYGLTRLCHSPTQVL